MSKAMFTGNGCFCFSYPALFSRPMADKRTTNRYKYKNVDSLHLFAFAFWNSAPNSWFRNFLMKPNGGDNVFLPETRDEWKNIIEEHLEWVEPIHHHIWIDLFVYFKEQRDKVYSSNFANVIMSSPPKLGITTIIWHLGREHPWRNMYGGWTLPEENPKKYCLLLGIKLCRLCVYNITFAL